jgi:hypothetical protein
MQTRGFINLLAKYPINLLVKYRYMYYFQLENAEAEDYYEALSPLTDIVEIAGCHNYMQNKDQLVSHLTRFLLVDRMHAAYER